MCGFALSEFDVADVQTLPNLPPVWCRFVEFLMFGPTWKNQVTPLDNQKCKDRLVWTLAVDLVICVGVPLEQLYQCCRKVSNYIIIVNMEA